MNGKPVGKKLLAVGAFLMLGLSPSYVDWQKSPDKRPEIVLYYGVAVGLFWYGLLS